MIVLAASVIATPALAEMSAANPACSQPLPPGAERRAAATGACVRTLGQRRAPALADRKTSARTKFSTAARNQAGNRRRHAAARSRRTGPCCRKKQRSQRGYNAALLLGGKLATGAHPATATSAIGLSERIIASLTDDKGRRSSISCANGKVRGDAGEPDVQITGRKKGGFT